MINNTQLITINHKALLGEITPAGISLTAVLGFFSSISLSIYLLKAIAALLAKTITAKTFKNKIQLIVAWALWVLAKKKPIQAKGRAKMVWLNLMRDR